MSEKEKKEEKSMKCTRQVKKNGVLSDTGLRQRLSRGRRPCLNGRRAPRAAELPQYKHHSLPLSHL